MILHFRAFFKSLSDFLQKVFSLQLSAKLYTYASDHIINES